jgi:hypothetical protein
MTERGWIKPIVERVVGQVLESHVAQLRDEIVRRVMDEVASESQGDDAGFASPSSDLARAVSEIQLGTSQREILRALLDASSRYAARVALFVVKGNHATGWQGRGFANNDAIKDFALDENAPAVARAIGDRVAANVPVADQDPRFFQEAGTPASGEARIFPLILKDKVAALVYADSGTGSAGLLDVGSLELLVLSTSAWLEVNSLRKQAQKEPSAAHTESSSLQAAEVPAHSPQAAPAFPAFNDPFASHGPAFAPPLAKAAAASAGDVSSAVASQAFEAPAFNSPAAEVPTLDSQALDSPTAPLEMETSPTLTSQTEPMSVESASASTPWPSELQSEVHSEVQSAVHSEVQSAVAEMEPALAAPLQIGRAETVFAPPPVAAPSLSPEHQEIHRKAHRFARLLVDEIKLYNQAKVAEGRENRDVYDRLREVIEKSRATYQKRYGNTVAASANYFDREIISSLAEDDPSIMGANFRQ